MQNFSKYLMVFAFLFAIVACNDKDDMMPEAAAPNLVDAANQAGLSTLLTAVQTIPGLAPALLEQNAITVFAPTNDAFSGALTAFGASDLNELVDAIGGPSNLETVLGFHVVPAIAFAADLGATNTFTTLAGQQLTVNRNGNTVTVIDAAENVATVITADVRISNGVVHVIDRVLLPAIDLPTTPAPNLVEAATAANLTTLLAAVTAVDGLANTLLNASAITVFAPTNDAFSNALQAFNVTSLDQLVAKIGGLGNLERVLGFHVVPAVAFSSDLQATNTFQTLAGQSLTVTREGSTVRVTGSTGNTANVVAADVAISNGVVHVIDGVLLPTIDLPTIVEAATAANLTTLLAAVTAAGLGETLLGAEAITVFAPTNAAFGSLLESLNLTSLEALIETLGVEAVVKVLGYHVVPAAAFSFDLAEGVNTLPTLAGENLTVTRTGNNVTVRDAGGNTFNVVTANVAIANGVVHVINGVVLPTLN